MTVVTGFSPAENEGGEREVGQWMNWKVKKPNLENSENRMGI